MCKLFCLQDQGPQELCKCALEDDLTPVLKKAGEADILFFGSPIYFGTATGEMRAFMERLPFPCSTYTDPPGSLFPRKTRTASSIL